MSERITVEVLRTSDANRDKLEISLSKSLNELKEAISTSSLGPIDAKHQRLFHLGRELKNGGRSLSSLGLGRFHNFILHLHSTKPNNCDLPSSSSSLQDDDDDDDNDVVEVETVKKDKRKRAASVVDLMDSDEEADVKKSDKKRRGLS